MLELAILGLLKEKDMHGYELKKRLADTLGFASGVSFGSLYPALRRLEAAGAVKDVDAREVVASVPLTGSLGGELAAIRARKVAPRSSRGKKVYGITDRGQALFAELLETESQSSDDDRTFNLRLAFARYLPPDVRLGMLERRRSYLLERRLQLRSLVATVRDAYLRSLVEHDHESAERDLSWIERLIARERESSAPGQGGEQVAPPPQGVPAPRVEDRSPVSPDQTAGAAAARLPGQRPGANQEDINR
jgi:DNA-binding PadR family transcriptional regulator